MDQPNRLRFLFDKYLQRQCSPEEVEELIARLQQDKARDSLEGGLRALWNASAAENPDYPVDWDSIYQSVIRAEDRLPVIRTRRRRLAPWMLAASLLLLAGAGFYRYLNHPSARPADRETASRPPAKSEAAAGSKKRQTIHLPDGSSVILNADSRLDYPSAFKGKTREIYLSGEAYFDIRHDPNKPFLVHTGKITTRVLGTAFDIRAYPSDESIKVTVTRGKVQVLKENKSLGLISANQQISFSKITEDYAETTVDSKSLVAWKPEEISFNDVSMLEAARTIEQRFGAVVVFSNPAIKNCRVTATFSEDDVLEEMLIVICGVSKSTFTIQNNKIIIDGKGCKE